MLLADLNQDHQSFLHTSSNSTQFSPNRLLNMATQAQSFEEIMAVVNKMLNTNSKVEEVSSMENLKNLKVPTKIKVVSTKPKASVISEPEEVPVAPVKPKTKSTSAVAKAMKELNELDYIEKMQYMIALTMSCTNYGTKAQGQVTFKSTKMQAAWQAMLNQLAASKGSSQAAKVLCAGLLEVDGLTYKSAWAAFNGTCTLPSKYADRQSILDNMSAVVGIKDLAGSTNAIGERKDAIKRGERAGALLILSEAICSVLEGADSMDIKAMEAALNIELFTKAV